MKKEEREAVVRHLTDSLSAWMRERLTENENGQWLVSGSDLYSATSELVKSWRVSSEEIYQAPTGFTWSGEAHGWEEIMSLGIDGEGRQWEPGECKRVRVVRGSFSLPPTPVPVAELERRERNLRARLWSPEDGPPPENVTTLQLLDQRVWWKPLNSDPIKVNDMEISHVVNLVNFFMRKASIFHSKELRQFYWGPSPSGDAASDAWEDGLSELEKMNPQDWLRGKSLMKRLRNRLVQAQRKGPNPATDQEREAAARALDSLLVGGRQRS